MKNIVKVSLAGALGFAAVSGIAHAQSGASDKAFSGRLALYSEYEFRGISQTSEKPALQLNLDYAHVSGFYVGTFLSNIKWLKDTAEQNGFNSNSKIEWNLYGGYKFQPVENLTLDFGYLHFEYPNSSDFSPRPNTDELYIGAIYGPASLKYSISLKDDTFGVPNSKGSDFIELAINYPLPMLPELTINGSVGRQTYRNKGNANNNSSLNVSVWKIGASYDLGSGFTIGAYGKDTNANPEPYTVLDRDWSKQRFVAFAAYSF